MKILLSVVLAAFCGSGFCEDQPLAPIPEKTIVSATLDVPHQKGQNLIWCSTFQLAWDALGKDFCGEPLRLEGTPPFEKSMNAAHASLNDIDAESVFTQVGKVTPAFLGELNAALKKRFADNAPPPVKVDTEGDLKVLAYAFLYKNLAFKTPFDKLKEPMAWFAAEGGGAALQAFGIVQVGPGTSLDLMRQIKIINDKPGEYIIELVTTSEKDHLFLAQTKPGETLQATLDAVHKKAVNPERAPFAIQLSDRCLVPCVQIALERVYSEIIKKNILNAKLAGFYVSDARQNIRFQLDEKGAVLKSESKLAGTKNGHQPRSIEFDEPFLLYIERAGAKSPYLAIWFENPNLFTKSDALAKPKSRQEYKN